MIRVTGYTVRCHRPNGVGDGRTRRRFVQTTGIVGLSLTAGTSIASSGDSEVGNGDGSADDSTGADAADDAGAER